MCAMVMFRCGHCGYRGHSRHRGHCSHGSDQQAGWMHTWGCVEAVLISESRARGVMFDASLLLLSAQTIVVTVAVRLFGFLRLLRSGLLPFGAISCTTAPLGGTSPAAMRTAHCMGATVVHGLGRMRATRTCA